jgi:hypothetical protein
MTDTQRLDSLLDAGNGGSVKLARKDAQELAQKLRARGGADGLKRLEKLLERPGDVELERDEARTLLDDLRASGRRWMFGADDPPAPRERPEAEPLPGVQLSEPDPPSPAEPRPGFFSRLLGRRNPL